MKALRGEASAALPAPPRDCFALLLDVEQYPVWHPEVVRSAQVIQRNSDGSPALAATTVHFGLGPVARNFDLLMAITAEPQRSVRLTRVRHEPSDPEEFSLTWQIGPDQPTTLSLELTALLEVPRLLPLAGIGDLVAQGFVTAAQRALQAAGS